MLDSQVLRNPMAVTFRKGTLDPHIISINMNRYVPGGNNTYTCHYNKKKENIFLKKSRDELKIVPKIRRQLEVLEL